MWAVAIGTVLVLTGISVLKILSNKAFTKEQANEKFIQTFEKASKEGNAFSGVQALVYSSRLGIDWQFAKGKSLRAGTLTKEVPFHVASVGKLFTATILYQLAEEGKIGLDDSITRVYDKAKLGNIFVYNGIDYTEHVTYRHLLSHTSGLPDYFDGPVIAGENMQTLLKTQSDKVWQPEELLAFSIENQKGLNTPGVTYHYSDTGYILLGLLIESITGHSFESALEERIFEPSMMNDSYMSLRSKPLSGNARPIADLWLEGMEFGDKQALTVDWAGGGIISTLEDLKKFSIALHSGKLISNGSLDFMFSGSNKFEQGIFTGDGGMIVRFEKFFPLLNLPRVRGHIGILSTHVFYDPTTETHIILNFGSTDKMVPSFKALIEILSVIKRIMK